MGYHQAGFTDIVGVDHRVMPRYPFSFVQADALEYLAQHGHEFDAIHASPPCQAYSYVANHSRDAGKTYPDLIADLWWVLQSLECPWIIENVPGAPMAITLMLCGTMFDPPLQLRRHRIFESNISLEPPQWPCRHRLFGPRFRIYEHGRWRKATTHRAHGANVTDGAAEAMGIDWMKRDELTQAIPPAYTYFIGSQLIKVLE